MGGGGLVGCGVVVWCCREDVGFKDLCYKDSSFLHGGLFLFAAWRGLLFRTFFVLCVASIGII